jgi:hypothetical protein
MDNVQILSAVFIASLSAQTALIVYLLNNLSVQIFDVRSQLISHLEEGLK